MVRSSVVSSATVPRVNSISCLGWSGLAAYPLKGSRGDQAHDEEVLPAETGRVFPIVTVFVRPLEGDIEQRTLLSFLAPDARANGAVADLVNRLIV